MPTTAARNQVCEAGSLAGQPERVDAGRPEKTPGRARHLQISAAAKATPAAGHTGGKTGHLAPRRARAVRCGAQDGDGGRDDECRGPRWSAIGRPQVAWPIPGRGFARTPVRLLGPDRSIHHGFGMPLAVADARLTTGRRAGRR